MSLFPKSEIKAIGKLLKGADENTLRLIEEQLKNLDLNTLKEINNELSLDDIKLRKQFLNLVSKIKRDKLKADFNIWGLNKSNDLMEGILLIALFNNPLLDIEHYKELLKNWSGTLEKNIKKVKLNNDPTSVINEVNHFLFMELGFKGNKEKYYDPDNSYLDRVIDGKKGNPILLSVLYLIITSKIGLPFTGVNMPAHFLVQYADNFDPVYIDPFSQGEIITKKDCNERIKTLNLKWQEDYLSSPTNKQIIIRVMQNLINIYQSEGEIDSKEYLENYVNIIRRGM